MGDVTLTRDMPIMKTGDMHQRLARGDRMVFVQSVPVEMFTDVAERQCQTNHQQTLEEIRRRAGLDAGECIAILSCLRWSDIDGLGYEAAHRILYAMVATFNRGQRVAEARVSEPAP